MTIHPDIIGYIAAILTTSCFVPQAIKTIRSRDTSSVSLWMYILLTLGIGFWLVYGIMIRSLPIIIPDTIAFTLSAIILYYKITERKCNNK